MHEDFKKAGALRQTVSQIWNRKGTFKLGFMWEYKDEKAFIACQNLFREAEMKFEQKAKISSDPSPIEAAGSDIQPTKLWKKIAEFICDC